MNSVYPHPFHLYLNVAVHPQVNAGDNIFHFGVAAYCNPPL